MLVLVKFLYMYVFFVYIIRIVSFGFVNKNILIERIYYIKSFLILLYFFVIDKNQFYIIFLLEMSKTK